MIPESSSTLLLPVLIKTNTELMYLSTYLLLLLPFYYCSVGAAVHVESWPLFHSFLIKQTIGRILWEGDQPVVRPLPTQDNPNTE
jgi:hypothetical protein